MTTLICCALAPSRLARAGHVAVAGRGRGTPGKTPAPVSGRLGFGGYGYAEAYGF